MSDEAYTKHMREQILRWREATPLERLRWLEQAKEFAALATAAAERRSRPR